MGAGSTTLRRCLMREIGLLNRSKVLCNSCQGGLTTRSFCSSIPTALASPPLHGSSVRERRLSGKGNHCIGRGGLGLLNTSDGASGGAITSSPSSPFPGASVSPLQAAAAQPVWQGAAGGLPRSRATLPHHGGCGPHVWDRAPRPLACY